MISIQIKRYGGSDVMEVNDKASVPSPSGGQSRVLTTEIKSAYALLNNITA